MSRKALLAQVILCALASSYQAVAAQVPTTEIFSRVRSNALDASPEVQAARSAVAAARGRLAATGFGPPAVISAEVEEVPGGFGFDGPFPLRIMVEKAFQRRSQGDAAREVAGAEVQAAEVRLASMQRSVAARVDLAMVRTLGWSALASRLAAENSILSSAAASINTRLASGEARYIDVIRLRTEQLQVQASLSQALSESRAARRQIEGLIPPRSSGGMRALDLVDRLADRLAAEGGGIDLLSPLLEPPTIDSLIAQAGAVRLAETEVDMAASRRRLVTALQRPDLVAYVGAERTRGDGAGVVYGPVAGISMSLPFTANRANRAAREAAGLAEVAAEATLTATRSGVRADLLAARERYEAALAQVAVFDVALLEAARAEREGALASYRAGQITLTEFLDFERGLVRAERARILSQIDAARALAELVGTAFGASDPAIPAATDVGAGSPGGGL